MAAEQEPITIKKYANRRLYNTGTSSYVTLDDLARMVKRGEDFLVCDAKTGEDITRSVLTQIIFDAEAKGQSLLPITFLRQLIRFYDDSVQHLVPPYLEHALAAFSNNREKLMAFTGADLGAAAVGAIEEQTRRNMELFQKSMRVFMPLAPDATGKKASSTGPETHDDREARPTVEAPTWRDFEAMRNQLQSMQERVDALAGARQIAAGLAEPDPTPFDQGESASEDVAGAGQHDTSDKANR